MHGALPQRVHREPRLVGARLLGEEPGRGLRTAGVDGASDVGGPLLIRPETGLAGADLVVAQARFAALGQQFGELAHITDLADDDVVTVAVGVTALGDQQRRRAGRRVLQVAVGAVNGEAVGLEADLVFDPLLFLLIRRAPGR